MSDSEEFMSEDDYSGGFSDDENEGNQQFVSEVHAYDRVGMSGAAAAMSGIVFTEYTDLQRQVKKSFQEPRERFVQYVNAISRNLSNNPKVNISEDDIVVLINKTQYIKNIDHINPTAYILGYLATKGGQSMKRVTVNGVINDILPSINYGGITPPDVVRYSRFWMEL